MENRLEGIKIKLETLFIAYTDGDMPERVENEIDVVQDAGPDVKWLISELEACKAENAELNALFELQHSRSQKADKLWQAATGKHDTIPGLGVLLEWLMGEAKDWKRYEKAAADDLAQAEADVKELEKIIKDLGWRKVGIPQQKKHQFNMSFQRHHRKWALKEMRKLKNTYKGYEEDCNYQYRKAEKFKKRVGELTDILIKHGISH